MAVFASNLVSRARGGADMCSYSVTVCLGLFVAQWRSSDGVTEPHADQQNEIVYVPTVIAHTLGGVRLGFEGLLGLIGGLGGGAYIGPYRVVWAGVYLIGNLIATAVSMSTGPCPAGQAHANTPIQLRLDHGVTGPARQGGPERHRSARPLRCRSLRSNSCGLSSPALPLPLKPVYTSIPVCVPVQYNVARHGTAQQQHSAATLWLLMSATAHARQARAIAVTETVTTR
eukprot:6495768-Pyramimonas_sp.AAC.1